MSVKVIMSPIAKGQEDWLKQLPRNFFSAEGETLHCGRNTIRAFQVDGKYWVVKRFKRLGLIKRLIYTFARSNKARQSFDNASHLLSIGFDTPQPIAYIEVYSSGLLSDAYYVCEYDMGISIEEGLCRTLEFDQSLATAFADYVVQLHNRGVLHHDLNSGNILFHKSESGTYHFSLIDVNRVDFYPQNQGVPQSLSMENLTLFTANLQLHEFVVRHYLLSRGWDEMYFEQMIEIKRHHDIHWRRKKMLAHPLRHLTQRCQWLISCS